jgi:hypothetical protein
MIATSSAQPGEQAVCDAVSERRKGCGMSKTHRARADLEQVLAQGEAVRAIERAQVKGGTAKRMGKDLAISAAASAVGSAAGMMAMRVSAAAPTWVVVTDQRIMLFEYVQRGHRLGGMLFEVPRNEVTVTSKPGVFAGVELVDPTSGDPVMRLNFGVFKQSAAAVVTAAA